MGECKQTLLVLVFLLLLERVIQKYGLFLLNILIVSLFSIFEIICIFVTQIIQKLFQSTAFEASSHFPFVCSFPIPLLLLTRSHLSPCPETIPDDTILGVAILDVTIPDHTILGIAIPDHTILGITIPDDTILDITTAEIPVVHVVIAEVTITGAAIKIVSVISIASAAVEIVSVISIAGATIEVISIVIASIKIIAIARASI